MPDNRILEMIHGDVKEIRKEQTRQGKDIASLQVKVETVEDEVRKACVQVESLNSKVSCLNGKMSERNPNGKVGFNLVLTRRQVGTIITFILASVGGTKYFGLW